MMSARRQCEGKLKLSVNCVFGRNRFLLDFFKNMFKIHWDFVTFRLILLPIASTLNRAIKQYQRQRQRLECPSSASIRTNFWLVLVNVRIISQSQCKVKISLSHIVSRESTYWCSLRLLGNNHAILQISNSCSVSFFFVVYELRFIKGSPLIRWHQCLSV